jgi:hypothetical protein
MPTTPPPQPAAGQQTDLDFRAAAPEIQDYCKSCAFSIQKPLIDRTSPISLANHAGTNTPPSPPPITPTHQSYTNE